MLILCLVGFALTDLVFYVTGHPLPVPFVADEYEPLALLLAGVGAVLMAFIETVNAVETGVWSTSQGSPEDNDNPRYTV